MIQMRTEEDASGADKHDDEDLRSAMVAGAYQLPASVCTCLRWCRTMPNDAYELARIRLQRRASQNLDHNSDSAYLLDVTDSDGGPLNTGQHILDC